MTIGERIKKRRKEVGMSAETLAERIGKSPATVYRYENGDIRNLDSRSLLPIADALGVTPGILMGWDENREVFPSNVRPISDLHVQHVPMIGEVAAGEPIYAPEDWPVYVDAPVKCDAAITIKGESMLPNYLPGDVVYIRCTPDVPEGTVAVVFLDNEATIKHVYKRPTGLTLISDNPDYPPLMPEFEDYNRVRVFGVPVGYTRMYKKDPLQLVRKGFR